MRVLAVLVLFFGLSAYAQAACTTSYTVENATTAPVNVGQSWTATCSGIITGITVKADTPISGLITLRIYDGESVSAADLLYTQTGNQALVHGENLINLTTPVSVTNGQMYTFLLTDENNTGLRLRYDTLNGYAGGQATAGAGFVAGSDIWFRIDVGDPFNVPTLSEWGAILLSLLILTLALLKLKRKSI